MLVISFGISACSSFKLIYRLAEDFIKQEVAYFLNLDEKGKAILNVEVSELMAWHDSVMLPRYAVYLRHQAEKLENGEYGAGAITNSMAEGRTLLEDTVAGAAPYVSRILVHHTSSKDIEHVRQKMAERVDNQQEKLERNLKQRVEERSERLTKNFERFIDNLNEKQKRLIRRYAERTISDAKRRLDHRILRQSAFLNFLAQKPAESEITDFTKQILLRSHEVVDPTYQKFSEESVNRITMLLSKILTASTYNQRKITAETIRNYAQDITDLSR